MLSKTEKELLVQNAEQFLKLFKAATVYIAMGVDNNELKGMALPTEVILKRMNEMVNKLAMSNNRHPR